MPKKNKYQNIADEDCKQAVIFARVSSEEQKKGASIKAQLKSVQDYCDNITPTKPQKLKVLQVFSITESSTRGERKLFYEMLDYVKKQTHKTAIVVNCVDRLQRGYKECVELDDLRKQGRIELHFYKENLILTKDSTSSDIMRWDMGVLSAKMYVGALRDNVIRSMDYKREHGQWQSCAPVGYLNISRTKNTQADIIIDEERAPKVKRLFEEYAKGGRTLQDITNLARSMGLYSKMCRVKKTISRAQVRNILKNPFYIGFFINKGKIYQHHYEHLIDKELFEIVQDVMEGRKRAPSHLYYGDKQYILTGLVKCGCCGSLMTCETKVKDAKHSYNYIKCNHLKKTCTQKPLNEAKVLKQIEEALSLPMNISDEMLKNLKAEVRKKLKEESKVTASMKKNITEQLQALREEEKILFKGYVQGKCDEEMYNEMKAEISEKRDALQKTIDRYNGIDDEIDDICEKIIDITVNAGKILKSPIISLKRDFLRLILSDFFTDGKNVVFSIVKPFDKLLQTAEINKWCAILCAYRTDFYDEYKQLGYKLELLSEQDDVCQNDEFPMLSLQNTKI